MSEFATAPPSIRERLAELQKKHDEEFANLLHGKLGSYGSDAPGPGPQDDPRKPPQSGEDPTPPPPVDTLPFLESESAMKSAHKIIASCKAFDSNGVMVFMSENGQLFLMSKDWIWGSKLTFFL